MDAKVDVVILGGGIAGLWLLDCLLQAGFSACVLNKGDLGQGQSIAAQGIIHGGSKYFNDSDVSDLAPMPDRWRQSLSGQSGPDLSAAPVLADAMGMWLPRRFGSGIVARLAKKSLLRQVRERGPDDRPSVLPHGLDGNLFDVDEAVIDVPKVLQALYDLHPGQVRGLPVDGNIAITERDDGGVNVMAGGNTVQAQRVVCTAGAGNETLLAAAGLQGIKCQRRPLQQIIIRGMAVPIYLHCIGRNPKPLATITSHADPLGGYYWYVGGLLAEDGVGRRPEQLIATARDELSRLLPGADFTAARWATHTVDRAEPAGAAGAGLGRRPGFALALARGPLIVGWPTKLALAPVLADKVLTLLAEAGVRPEIHDPGARDLARLANLPVPAVARPPWEMVGQWN